MSTHQPALYDMKAGEVVVEAMTAKQIADDLNAVGNRYYLASDLARAEAHYIKAVEADANSADAWGNLGLIWHTIGAREDALHCYMKSLALDPNSHTNLTNVGMLYEDRGYTPHAEACYRKALELKPGFPRAQGNLAALLLRRGDYVAGWDLFECRFSTNPPISIMRTYPFPRWDGLPTRQLAIWAEQGIGDQILYLSLLPELLEQGHADIVVELDARLVPAFRRSFKHNPTVTFVSKEDSPKAFAGSTAHVPMMSLPWFFRRTHESFDQQPWEFLTADPDRKAGMGLPRAEWRVAMSWRSFHPDINKRQCDAKSAPLDAFRAFDARLDVKLIGVQYGPVETELATWGGRPIYFPEIDLKADVEGVLAAIDSCDSVVTTSNVTAHFAGALGKETYLVCKERPTLFYWQPRYGRSLFYPSVKVIVGETWEEAMKMAAASC